MNTLATGDLIKLGTFFKANAKQLLPTNPWRSGSTPGGGNIPVFAAGQALEVRDTDPNDAYKLRWRELVIGSKKLLIADRNILEQVSWDDLNAQGLVTGKEITIDGQQYKLRLMTGGSNYRNTSDAYAGGTPTANEWDQIISGEANYPGLPKPAASDLDSSLVPADQTSAHNQFWNWYYMYSWVQEVYAPNGSYRVFRGYHSARYFYYTSASNRFVNIGWRPVLEVLNSAPLISGGTQDLGNKTAPFAVEYQVVDPENDAVSVVEKLNGVTIRTIPNVSQGATQKIELTAAQWAAIPLNVASTITVEATDSKNAKSTRVYTFTKTNAPPTATAIEPKGDLSNIAIVDTLTPILVHSFHDIDVGDSQSAYQYVIENLQNDVVHDSGKKSSTQSFYQVPASVLNWGDRVKWKVRVWDRFDVPSEYSFPEFFMPNRAPFVTNLQPGSNDAENPMGAGMAPEFSWDFEDLDLEAQAAYQLKIFKASDDVLVYDSSRVNQNVQKHQVPTGRLAEGTIFYAIVTVWDPNGLKRDSEKSYIRTNATPSAPLQTGPIDNFRTTLQPTFSGVIGTDPEDDGMHFAIQISTDPTFVQYSLTYRSDVDRAGWKVNGYDIPEAGVFNDQQGQTVSYALQVGLDRNKTYYWRMAAVDAGTKARGVWSVSRRIRAGNELSFGIKNPISTLGVAARRILFAADYQLPTDGSNKATIKVEFSNNALDAAPTWEDATAQFLSMDYYNFTNTDKTAVEFAIGVRVSIIANDSMAPISIEAIGLTFD
ncbi:glycoside hydrolase family 78 protein [Sporosarcina sp. FSL K6-1508]|uniref:glycoside hydrolase family 78 protein n=1 Tax=Sporosarcina sp. FSL K6-1508 TaxID=2921553 RepID=UPI0030F78589